MIFESVTYILAQVVSLFLELVRFNTEYKTKNVTPYHNLLIFVNLES